MKHLWSVLCSKYIISEASNSLSLIEIADGITFEAELPDDRPLELPLSSPLYLVSSWIREDDSEAKIIDALARIKSPAGSVLQELPFPVDLERTAGSRTFGTISTIPFTVDGMYEFELCIKDSCGWRAVGTVPVGIVCRPPAQESEEKSEPTA